MASNVKIRLCVWVDTQLSVKSFLDLLGPRGTLLVSPKAFLELQHRESRGFHEKKLTGEQNFRLDR